MVGLVGSIASISSGVIGISEGFTRMEQAQTSADRASNRYQQGLILLQTDQKKVNDLISEGKTGTPEYAKAIETLNLQVDKNKTALDQMNNAQSRASEATASFYSQLVPQAVGVLGGLATAINTVPTAWEKVKSALQDTNLFGGLKADATDLAAAQKDVNTAATDAGTALNTEGAAANTAATATRSLKSEALLLAAPFIASTAAVVAFALGMQKIGENAPAVHDFFNAVDTEISTSIPQIKGWASSFGDALAETGSFFNDNVKQIESWAGLSKSVMNASADDVQKYSDEFARSGVSESHYWDLRFAQWKQAADNSHQTYGAIAKDNIDQMREDQNKATVAQQVADSVAAAKKKEEDAAKHYADVVKDTSKVLEDDLNKSLSTLQQESTGVIKGWEQFGSSGTTVRTAFVDLNTAVVNTSKGLESHNQFANDTIKILTPLQSIAKQVGGTFQTEYNAAMLASIKVHNGVTDSIQPIITHLKAMDDATHTVNAGMDAQKDAFHAAGLAMIDTDGKLQQLEKTIQDGTQINQSFKQGQQDQEQAMRTNEEAIAKEAGSLKTYYDQLATGRPLNDAFIKGFADQAKVFGDQAVAIADTQGGLTAYFLAIQTGVPQLEAFDKGQQDQYAAFIQNGLAIDGTLGKQKEYFREIQDGSGVIQIQQKAIVDLTDAYIKSGEKLIAQNTDLTSSQALWTRYQTDVNAGKSAVAEFEIKLQDAKVAEDTQITGLKAIADGIGGLPAFMAPTIQNYQDFIKANYDGGAAAIDFNLKTKKAWTDLTSAGDTFFSGLIKSMGESGKTASDDFTKAFDSLEPQVKAILTKTDVTALTAAAGFAQAGTAAGQAFAVKTEAAINEGFTPQQAIQIGVQSAASIIQGFVQQHPQFAAQAQQFFSVLSSGSAEQIKAALDQMAKMPGPLGEIARNAQTALKPTFEKLAPDATSAVQTSVEQLDKLGLKVNTSSGDVTTATGTMVGKIDLVTGAFTSATTSASTFAAEVKGFGDISSTAQIVFQGIVTGANKLATDLGTAFKNAATDIAPGFGTMAQNAQTTFSGMSANASAAVSAIGSDFRTLPGLLAPSLGTIAQNAQTTFNGMGTNASAAVTAIGGSFKTLPGLLAQDFGTIASTAQTTFNNMVFQAQAAARAIAAAFQAAFAASQAPTAQSFAGGARAPQTASLSSSGFTPFQGVFAQHGFVGVVDKPTSFVVGEAGPEYVSVIPGGGGGAGQVNTALFAGLVDISAAIARANTAMTATTAIVTKNNITLSDSTTAQNTHNKSLNEQSTKLNVNNLAIDNSTAALQHTTIAANHTATALDGSGLTEATGNASQGLGNMTATTATAAERQGIYNSTLTAGAGTVTAMGMSAGAAGNQMGSMTASTATAAERMGVYNSTLNTGAGAVSGMSGQANTAGSSLQQTGNAAGQASQGLNTAGQSADSAGGSIGSFSSQMQQAGQAASSFAQAANSAATAMATAARSAVPQQAASPYGAAGTNPYQYGAGGYPSTLSGYNPATNPQLGQFYANQYYQPYYPGQQASYYGNPYGGQFFGFAKGFEGFVTSPTKFIAGEAGPEYVSVIPGANVNIGDTMTSGLSGLVTTINKSNSAMSTTWAAATNNTIAFNSVSASLGNNANAMDNSTDALNTHHTALVNDQTGLINCSGALSNTTNGLSNTTNGLNNTTIALGNTTSAADGVNTALNSLPPPTAAATIGLNNTAGAANNATSAINNMANSMQQAAAGGGAGGFGGGGVQGPAGAFAGLAGQILPSGGGAVPAVFAPYAQYGNFSGQSPAPAQGAAYYGGPPARGGGGAIQGAPYGVGPFGAYAQYGQFSAGQAPGGQAQGGVQGPQGGSSSPSQQQPKQAATGWEGILNSATKFIAGEQGPEHVSIRPVTATAATTDINSIMQLIAELVRQLQNQNMNVNVNSYLDGYQVYKNQQKYINGRVGNYLG